MPYNPAYFRKRLGYIGTRQDAIRGEPVQYTRGATTGWISAAPGHTDVQDLIPENAISVARYVDLIVFMASLTAAGFGLPQRGDKFVWEGNTYNVVPPTASDEVYTFTTMYRDRVRIHGLLMSPANS